MMGMGPWEWLIIFLVVMALFGYKKLPDAARSLGRSARILKAEVGGDKKTDDDWLDPKPR